MRLIVMNPRLLEIAPRFLFPLCSKHSRLVVGIQGNPAAQLPETGLKQVLWEMGSGRKQRKYLI